MSIYQLCFLDPNGKVDNIEIVNCVDDDEARIIAGELDAVGKYAGVEVWRHGRCVRLRQDAIERTG